MRTAAMIGMVLLLAGAPTIPGAHAHDEWDDWVQYCDSLGGFLDNLEVALLQCYDDLVRLPGGCDDWSRIFDQSNGLYMGSGCQQLS